MKKLFYILCLMTVSVSLMAEQKKDWGRVSASLESTNHVYVDDKGNDFYPIAGTEPNLKYLKNRYATNNYLKVDYYKGRLSAGLQVEGYFPVTVGYPLPTSMLTLSNLYFNWTDDSYSVHAGTFYEQLGSGLLFRSWEDRALGINNAIVGARATYKYEDYFSVKVFGGMPRMGKQSVDAFNFGTARFPVFGFGFTKTAVAAADASISLSDCFGWERVMLSVEGSFLYKYENLPSSLTLMGFKSHNIGGSARVNFDIDNFYFKGEYVNAGVQDYIAAFPKNANAQLIEIGYNEGGLGVSLSARRVWAMNQKVYTANQYGAIEINSSYDPSVNVLAYCPALCTQYTYMLANLIPYRPRTDGEAGGQIDAFYNFRRGTKIGGKRGMKVHANFSTYFNLNDNGGFKGGAMRMWDFSFDIEKQWTKKFKSTLMYSAQQHNSLERDYLGAEVEVGQFHTVVADLLYKWTPTISTRLELQYLATKGYQKDWMAALLEVSFAPHWSVYASDMYNHGSSKMHYYNAGVSYSMRWLRVAAGYGRYRAGFICSGGVCREIPAYTGANITLTASF